MHAASPAKHLSHIAELMDAMEKRAGVKDLWSLAKGIPKAVGGFYNKVRPATGAPKAMALPPPLPGSASKLMNSAGLLAGGIGAAVPAIDSLTHFSNPIAARQQGAREALTTMGTLPGWQRAAWALDPAGAMNYSLQHPSPKGWMDSIRDSFKLKPIAGAVNDIQLANKKPALYSGLSSLPSSFEQAGLTSGQASTMKLRDRVAELEAKLKSLSAPTS